MEPINTSTSKPSSESSKEQEDCQTEQVDVKAREAGQLAVRRDWQAGQAGNAWQARLSRMPAFSFFSPPSFSPLSFLPLQRQSC